MFITDSANPGTLAFVAFYLQTRADAKVQKDVWSSMITHIRRSAAPLASIYLVALLAMKGRSALPPKLPLAELDDLFSEQAEQQLKGSHIPKDAELNVLGDVLVAQGETCRNQEGMHKLSRHQSHFCSQKPWIGSLLA